MQQTDVSERACCDLERPVRIPCWPEPAPRWRVVANVATEEIHHGAEIGVLRDLYQRRIELGS